MLERGNRYHPKMRIPTSWEVVTMEIRTVERRAAESARSLLGRKSGVT
jgi:hypothetical protein